MKRFIQVLILLLLALAVAGFSQFNNRQVAIFVLNYRAELSLYFLVAIWLFSLVLFYYLVRLYVNLGSLPSKIRRARVKNALILSRRHISLAGLEVTLPLRSMISC